MKKFSRQAKILSLIKEHNIETQEELTEALRMEGFDVAQGTVSRDIKELALIKTMYGNDHMRQKYARNDEESKAVLNRLQDAFRSSVLGYECAGNLVVIKTMYGMANATALMMDLLENELIVGTVSGFNTVFVATRSDSDSLAVLGVVEAILDE